MGLRLARVGGIDDGPDVTGKCHAFSVKVKHWGLVSRTPRQISRTRSPYSLIFYARNYHRSNSVHGFYSEFWSTTGKVTLVWSGKPIIAGLCLSILHCSVTPMIIGLPT